MLKTVVIDSNKIIVLSGRKQVGSYYRLSMEKSICGLCLGKLLVETDPQMLLTATFTYPRIPEPSP